MRLRTPPKIDPVTHLVSTPEGKAEVDIGGSTEFTFVRVTTFDAAGWAVGDDNHWGPAQAHRGDPLGAFLARVTGLEQSAAERLASELMGRLPAPEKADHNRRAFGRFLLQAVVWVLAQAGALALVAALATAAVMRRRLGTRRRRTG